MSYFCTFCVAYKLMSHQSGSTGCRNAEIRCGNQDFVTVHGISCESWHPMNILVKRFIAESYRKECLGWLLWHSTLKRLTSRSQASLMILWQVCDFFIIPVSLTFDVLEFSSPTLMFLHVLTRTSITYSATSWNVSIANSIGILQSHRDFELVSLNDQKPSFTQLWGVQMRNQMLNLEYMELVLILIMAWLLFLLRTTCLVSRSYFWTVNIVLYVRIRWLHLCYRSSMDVRHDNV